MSQISGWGTIEYVVRGEVTSSQHVGEAEVVSFVGSGGGRAVAWERSLDESGLKIGQPVRRFMGGDGHVYTDRIGRFAGVRVVAYWSFLAFFILFSIRRSFALWVAWRDVHRSGDEPRFGYAALVNDPMPKRWKPLLLLWEEDPTGGDRIARPDRVYRADEETGQHLETYGTFEVSEAWIDTARFPLRKPRWVGTEEAVLIPHQRSWVGALYLHRVSRKWPIEGPEPLRHRPPEPWLAPPVVEPRPVHRLRGMFVWRAAGAILIVGLVTLMAGDEGAPAVTFPPPQNVGRIAWDGLQARLGPAEMIDVREEMVPFAEHHHLLHAESIRWVESPDRIAVERWRFTSTRDAEAVAAAELADWMLTGTKHSGAVVADLEDGGRGAAAVFVSGRDVLKVVVSGETPSLDLLDRTIAEIQRL